MKKNRSWPYSLTVFYVLFVGAVIGFCFWSGFHRVDLVTKHYYADEIAYQDRIDSRSRAANLEHPPSITYQEDRVRIHFPQAPERGTTLFYRPSTPASTRPTPSH